MVKCAYHTKVLEIENETIVSANRFIHTVFATVFIVTRPLSLKPYQTLVKGLVTLCLFFGLT